MLQQKKYNNKLSIKSKLDEEYIICGYASVFDIVDSDNDIIIRGAFQNSCAKKIKLLWQHDRTKPIGIVKKLFEDNYGLYVECAININVALGKDAISLINQGAIESFSIGFIPKQFCYNKNGQKEITEIDLYEISLVTFPANEKAEISYISDILKTASVSLLRLKKSYL